MSKLYVITRSDLAAGAQAAQATHAAIAFVVEHHDLARAWHIDSNNLVILTAPNEAALARLLAKSDALSVPRALFHEPGFGGELTAIAMHGEAAGKLVSSLPLALRAPRAA